MLTDLLVLSNNAQVWNFYHGELEKIEFTPREVLYRALELLSNGEGYALLAHPIAGNARLLRNPFRTLILGKGNRGRGTSITLEQQMAFIVRSLDKMEDIDYGEIPSNTYQDYATVDYELFKTTLESFINE
jgi:hypothetical protein